MSGPDAGDNLEMLLGGWAAGTLSDDERRRLLEAALTDQDLFDKLMEEEPLREALADGPTRAALLEALAPRLAWWRSPWPWTGFAAAAAASLALFFLLRPQPAVEIARGPAPQPVASTIETPKQLKLSEPAPALRRPSPLRDKADKVELDTFSAPAAAPPARAFPAEVQNAAQPPPPPPPPAIAESIAVRGELKKAEDLAVGGVAAKAVASEQVRFDARAADGAWQQIPPGRPLPSGRALRLTVTSPDDALLEVAGTSARLDAGIERRIELPAQPRGELVLRFTEPARLTPMRMREGRADAREFKGALAPAREIRLKIE